MAPPSSAGVRMCTCIIYVYVCVHVFHILYYVCVCAPLVLLHGVHSFCLEWRRRLPQVCVYYVLYVCVCVCVFYILYHVCVYAPMVLLHGVHSSCLDKTRLPSPSLRGPYKWSQNREKWR